MMGRPFFIRLHWIFSSQFGLNPRSFLRSLRWAPRFFRDWLRFRLGYAGSLTCKPCLDDWYDESGVTRSEYFWQDLLVAGWIFEHKPAKHVDVGSRVDGFVAHVASFREIEVFDVRPAGVEVPGIRFKQADLMRPVEGVGEGYCDSLSCLHAIEHFGLGRYGDSIDPLGYQLGIANLARLLRHEGRLYLSTPIGRERVEFNANRVFDPRTIVRCATENGLSLRQLTVLGTEGTIHQVEVTEKDLEQLAMAGYALGLFVFTKNGK